MQKKFLPFLYESVNNKQESNVYLTSEKYNSLINEVKETVLSIWLKRYDILNIDSEEKLAAPLFAEKNKNPVLCDFLTNCSTSYVNLVSLLTMVEEPK